MDLGHLALVGAGGGLIYICLVRGGVLTLPRLRKGREGLTLSLGFLASLVIGAGTAMLVDRSWQTALAAAVGGPAFLEGLVKGGLLVGKEMKKNATGSG